ncbi:uncharacterized protein LTR77_009329 [Saxophila tyrrhenica]|uniref:DH domain-containing protein n=1 Tax=Saxophila tyrrhenica TaxID=1690608 RepID=A0AAV9NYQ9_9PEZI|nr:hypothetical protein LTR77_009329 [Saxophila tyrrhenica]
MATVIPAPPALSGDLFLFHTTDPLLANSPVLVFHGPAASIGATSSRIQVHIFTAAGYASYARLAVSPNSPLYSAVSNLPREEQGDEVVRGIAFGLKKYFNELDEGVKRTWCKEAKAPSPAALFGNDHIAILASRMTRIDNVDEVIREVGVAFGEMKCSWLDADVVLPAGSIKASQRSAGSAGLEEFDESQGLAQRYGRYAELVDSLGDLVFMPTSKMRRAPSKSTSVGRTASFLRHQKETVRKELNELLDTEVNYVDRINELAELSSRLGGSEASQLRGVFPASIADIARLNSEFLTDLKQIFEATETTALQDIEAMEDIQPSAQQARQDFVADTQGVGAIAKCLCDWFPKFSEAYSNYMQSQASATALLRDILKTGDPSVVASLQDVGEQKLTSLLIEPVQRLPRYNLYIDTIAKQLPVRHPAIKPLLKARDMITEICDHGGSELEGISLQEKLKGRVSAWPSGSTALGRLVTATDFVELAPPYASESCDADRGILLVFTDSIVMLEKRGSESVSAKALLTELDSGHGPMRQMHGRPHTPHDLTFVRRVQLDAVQLVEAQDGKCIQLLTMFKLDGAVYPPQLPMVDSCQILRIEGFYERKLERLVEEVTKARIEGRFSEAEREAAKWEVRASDPSADTASLLSAIFEDSNHEHVSTRTSTAPIRLIVDIDRHAQRPRATEDGIRTIMAASLSRDGTWRLTIESVDGKAAPESVNTSQVVSALRRQLTTLSSFRYTIEQSSMTSALLAKHGAILQTLNLQAAAADDDAVSVNSRSERTSRPKSPKKFLSSFLSSTGPGSQPPAFLKKDLPPLPPPSRLPSVQSNTSTMKPPSLPPSRDSRPPSRDPPTLKSMTSMRSMEPLASPHKKLEETLATYMLALQARKGNIVGRSLKMRATADELAVNELYNSVLEDPNMMVFAAQATVDVLFAAFEKFLNVAWREQMGQILPFSTLQEIQSKAETLFPAEFDQYFKVTIGQLSPQNQRAFKGIMKLLADLLDGTGNDGDRGILTAAFAEVLVTEGNPHDYIALIDRFVDDPDTYFGEPLEEVSKTTEAGFNPHKRARSVNSASISSNTSSLRKKFGLGLSRENSKSEQDSKMASVWRTLSKSTRGEASPANSISRGTLHRSQSTDMDARDVPSRPVSQDGSPTHKTNYFGEDLSFNGTTSALNLGLSTIGEHPSFIPTQPPRKKRRSSLSDLKALEAAQQASPKPAWSPQAARRPPTAPRYLDEKSLPNSPVPSTPSSKGGSGRFGSPTRETPRSRLPSSFRKENSPGPSKALAPTPEQRPKSSGAKLDEVTITARPLSNIPTLTPKPLTLHKSHTSPPPRNGLAERPGAGNIVKKPSPKPDKSDMPMASGTTTTDAGSPKKLRMQSPQKLRERLQNEQSALAATHTSLQDELTKIGDELTSTPSRIGSVRAPGSHSRTKSTPSAYNPPANMDIAQRVLKLEGSLPTQMEGLNDRLSSIQNDLSSSLAVSEAKCKKLDELYREANSENEALYARFNDELGRILKAVKGGEGVEELKRQVREGREENGRLKRELGRVRRENVGLRAQLKE